MERVIRFTAERHCEIIALQKSRNLFYFKLVMFIQLLTGVTQMSDSDKQ